MALFANANSAKGKQFKPEDFLARELNKEPMEADAVFAKFDALFPETEDVKT